MKAPYRRKRTAAAKLDSRRRRIKKGMAANEKMPQLSD